jgi:hypothetical protein
VKGKDRGYVELKISRKKLNVLNVNEIRLEISKQLLYFCVDVSITFFVLKGAGRDIVHNTMTILGRRVAEMTWI